MNETTGMFGKLHDHYERSLQWVSSGRFFQKGFFYLLRAGAVLFLLAVFKLLSQLFGDHGYFDTLGNMASQGGWFLYIRGILVSILCLIIAIGTILGISYHVWMRAGTIRDSSYRGLFSILIQVLKYLGETLVFFPVSLFFITFFSVLFVAPPFIPNFFDWYFNIEIVEELMRNSYVYNSIGSFGDYLKILFTTLIGGALGTALSVFLTLFLVYFFAEVLEIVLHFFLRIPLYSNLKKDDRVQEGDTRTGGKF